MFGLTPLGVVHTLISLVPVIAGAVALTRDRKITYGNSIGRLYVATTVFTCVTGFGSSTTAASSPRGRSWGSSR
jgi:hypothetical protein